MEGRPNPLEAANRVRLRNAQEKIANKLRAAGWTCLPPDHQPVTYCNWCPDPAHPDITHHPDGTRSHRPARDHNPKGQP